MSIDEQPEVTWYYERVLPWRRRIVWATVVFVVWLVLPAVSRGTSWFAYPWMW